MSRYYKYEPKLIIRGSKIFYEFNYLSVNMEIDVTPLYFFFKEMFTTNWQEEFKNLKQQ